MASEKQQTRGASPSVADSSLQDGVRRDLLPKLLLRSLLACMLVPGGAAASAGSPFPSRFRRRSPRKGGRIVS